jgi:tetratricopeptide (TPR) repeat protein
VLAWSQSELGQFTEGAIHGEDAMRVAEELDNARAINTSCFSAAIVALRQGHVTRAIPLLEQSIQICRDTHLTIWLGLVTALMSYAYAQARQYEQARQLLADMPEPTDTIGFFAMPYFVEATMLTGGLSYAYDVAIRSLDITRTQNARGDHAHLLRLLGDLTRRLGANDADQAEAPYRQALAIAEELGMRPLQAHCHLGLGTLYGEQDKRELARQELSKAQALYRDMEMTFWLPQVETALSTLSVTCH